jgi:hypothetical protein
VVGRVVSEPPKGPESARVRPVHVEGRLTDYFGWARPTPVRWSTLYKMLKLLMIFKGLVCFCGHTIADFTRVPLDIGRSGGKMTLWVAQA